jgi:hypothetical protein
VAAKQTSRSWIGYTFAASRGLECAVSFDITFPDSTVIYKSRKKQVDSSIKIEKDVIESLHNYADRTFALKSHDTLKGEFRNDGLFANIYGYYPYGEKRFVGLFATRC